MDEVSQNNVSQSLKLQKKIRSFETNENRFNERVFIYYYFLVLFRYVSNA